MLIKNRKTKLLFRLLAVVLMITTPCSFLRATDTSKEEVSIFDEIPRLTPSRTLDLQKMLVGNAKPQCFFVPRNLDSIKTLKFHASENNIYTWSTLSEIVGEADSFTLDMCNTIFQLQTDKIENLDPEWRAILTHLGSYFQFFHPIKENEKKTEKLFKNFLENNLDQVISELRKEHAKHSYHIIRKLSDIEYAFKKLGEQAPTPLKENYLVLQDMHFSQIEDLEGTLYSFFEKFPQVSLILSVRSCFIDYFGKLDITSHDLNFGVKHLIITDVDSLARAIAPGAFCDWGNQSQIYGPNLSRSLELSSGLKSLAIIKMKNTQAIKNGFLNEPELIEADLSGLTHLRTTGTHFMAYTYALEKCNLEDLRALKYTNDFGLYKSNYRPNPQELSSTIQRSGIFNSLTPKHAFMPKAKGFCCSSITYGIFSMIGLPILGVLGYDGSIIIPAVISSIVCSTCTGYAFSYGLGESILDILLELHESGRLFSTLCFKWRPEDL